MQKKNMSSWFFPFPRSTAILTITALLLDGGAILFFATVAAEEEKAASKRLIVVFYLASLVSCYCYRHVCAVLIHKTRHLFLLRARE